MAETNGGVVVIKFKADTTDIDKAKKNIGNLSRQELAAERNELAKQRIELSKQRNLIAKTNAETKKYDATTKRIKVNNDRINQSVRNRLSSEKLNLQAQKMQNQMYTKMNGSAKKLNGTISLLSGKLLALFSVAALVNFGKEALQASSDVVEVQNVVDNAFPEMTKQIDEWAENSVKKFGMSEKAAKEYASMFGMIARSAGVSQENAFILGTNLTALTADLGSMLNKSNDDVYQKLRSGILSGMTKPMQQLGISMNEADVQAWMTSKGISAVYREMTQAEKIAVRYNYVLERTKLMQGDFANTQNTWANQNKQLSSSWEELKANLGDFLRTALLPLLRGLNQLIAKLNIATAKFKEFLSTTFNIKFDATGISEGSEEIADGLDDITDAAEETAAAVKKTLGPLDQLNILGDKSGKNSGAGTSGLGFGEYDNGYAGPDTEKLEKAAGLFDKIAKKAKEIAGSFKNGWDNTFKPEKWGKVKDSLIGIKDTIKNILTDPQVQSAADDYVNRMANAFGRISANVANVAGSIAVNFTEGFNRALKENEEDIKTTIVETYNFEARKAELIADATDAVASIAEVLESESAIQITEALDSIWMDVQLTGVRIYERLSTDILDVLVRPLTENAEKIKENLQAVSDALAPMFNAIKEFVDGAGKKLVDMYDQHIHPMFIAIGDFFSDFTGFVHDILGEFIDKYLTQISDWFVDFTNNKLTPLWDDLMECIGAIADYIKEKLGFLLPALKVVTAILAAVASVILDVIIPVVEQAFSIIVDVIDSVINIIKGAFQLLTGLLTGDFGKALEGLINIVGGVFEAIAGVVDGVLNTIIDSINNLFNTSFSRTNLVGWVKDLVKSLIGKVSGPSTSGNTRDRGYSSSMDGYSGKRFANGGFFAPNNSTIGMLGDNKSEKEYALTESHLDSIARRTASILQGGSGGGTPNINLQLQIDGEWLDARILSVNETNAFRG